MTRASLRLGAAVLVAFASSSCGRTEDAPRRVAPPPSATPSAVPATVLTREHAATLVEAWQRAQNEGAIDAYAALYASVLTGVRRTGERVEVFDRAAWLEDRRRMFAQAPRITIEAPIYVVTDDAIHVRFIQRYETSAYSDVGPKRLVLVPEDGTLVIAVEELLSSRRGAPEDDVRLVAFGELVLDDTPHALTHGPVHAVDGALIAEVQDTTRPRFTLVTATGETCVATVGAPYLRAVPSVTFGDRRLMASLDAAARDVYIWSASAHRLLASLDGPCADAAVLAVPDGRELPVVVPRRVLRGVEKGAYVTRFEASDVGARLDARFRDELARARALRDADPDVARAFPVLSPAEWASLDRARATRAFGGAFDVTTFQTLDHLTFIAYGGRGTCGELFAFTYGGLFSGEGSVDLFPPGLEADTSAVVLLERGARRDAVLLGRRGPVLVTLADEGRPARVRLDGRVEPEACEAP